MRNNLGSFSYRNHVSVHIISLIVGCFFLPVLGNSVVDHQNGSAATATVVPVTTAVGGPQQSVRGSSSLVSPDGGSRTTSLGGSLQSTSTTTAVSGSATTSSKIFTSLSIPGGISSTSRSTCSSRTVNYITHTLPQQCLKMNYTAAVKADGTIRPGEGSIGSILVDGKATGTTTTSGAISSVVAGQDTALSSVPTVSTTGTISAGRSGTASMGSEADTDSPLDNVNFLSFEEWKKQNMARIDKSKENLARDGAADAERKDGINNALASMSDGEEFDMSIGFGAAGANTALSKPGSAQVKSPTAKDGKVTPSERPRKKDAGTTCKERFNYASTDCAAAILKTNPKCKSASSVLKENKDSYMLNECSIANKFLIVELCDDILVDTVVLANFEFFSSMFRTFRISVAERYPVEMDRWKVLGTFEARNAREIQAFAIHNPLIWTRYLRVEFLNHYGAEYYCPVSLLRIHGTTMLDELRNPEEPTKAEEEIQAGSVIPSASPVIEAELPIASIESEKDQRVEQTRAIRDAAKTGVLFPSDTSTPSSSELSEKSEANTYQNTTLTTAAIDSNNTPSSTYSLSTSFVERSGKNAQHQAATIVKPESASSPATQGSGTSMSASDRPRSQASSSSSIAQSSIAPSSSSSIATSVTKQLPSKSSNSQNSKAQTPSSEANKPASSVVQPPTPAPTTQESFFKSFHKRLQVLESNATLSLQYIEEQSRILRDAFTKVEKRQKTKVDDFVLHLNTTVMGELKNFRQQYDQIWQSTILELESHRDDYQREILAVSTRLSMLAEELVWQKRMALVQTTLLVICLTLFIFGRSSSSSGNQLELPIMQQWLNKSQSMLGFPFDSPLNRSKSGNAGSRRLMRVRSVDDLDEDSDDHALQSSPSPALSASGKVDDDAYYGHGIATPTKPVIHIGEEEEMYIDNVGSTTTGLAQSGITTSATAVALRLKALGQSRSGPSTPRGTRELLKSQEAQESTNGNGNGTGNAGFWGQSERGSAERIHESSPLALHSFDAAAAAGNGEEEEEGEEDQEEHNIEDDAYGDDAAEPARGQRGGTVDSERTLVEGMGISLE